MTSLQFDDTRIVSGGSDGRVKIWNLHTGTLIRELSQPAEAVWRVAFEEERCVVLANRQGRTVMEVWDFAPPDEDTPVGGAHTSVGSALGALSVPVSRHGSAAPEVLQRSASAMGGSGGRTADAGTGEGVAPEESVDTDTEMADSPTAEISRTSATADATEAQTDTAHRMDMDVEGTSGGSKSAEMR